MAHGPLPANNCKVYLCILQTWEYSAQSLYKLCVLAGGPTHMASGLLVPLFLVRTPFDKAGIDITGILELTIRNCHVILVLVPREGSDPQCFSQNIVPEIIQCPLEQELPTRISNCFLTDLLRFLWGRICLFHNGRRL